MKVTVLTPSFPTRAEPYRGDAIFRALGQLNRLADVHVHCSLPDYWLSPSAHRDFIHDRPCLDDHPGLSWSELPFPAVAGLSRPVNGWLMSNRLKQELATRRPDVVLSFFAYPEGDAARRACVGLGVPFAVVSVGSDLKRLSAHPWIRLQTRRTLESAQAVLCVSADLCTTAERLGARSSTVRLWPLGVDGDTFALRDQREARAALGRADVREQIVLFVGRFVPLKGIPRLIEAMSLLQARAPGRWRAVFVGNGSLENEMAKQVRVLGLTRQVEVLGPRPPAEVALWMNAADVLCLPSESEGRPNVILEALSCGRPTVATRVGGIPELVLPDCGVLVDEPGAAGLADALERACATAWDREAIARRYRRTWKEAGTELFDVLRSSSR